MFATIVWNRLIILNVFELEILELTINLLFISKFVFRLIIQPNMNYGFLILKTIFCFYSNFKIINC